MAAKAIAIPYGSVLDADRHDVLGLVLSASLPLAVFIIANGMAHLIGTRPLFFAPFDVPFWAAAALHLGALPLFGVARWMVAGKGRAGRSAGWWVVGLMAGTIAFPFLVAPLDSLALSVVAMLLLVVALAAMARVAKISPRAALLMAPGLGWMGFSALMGLSFLSGWSPPFGPTNSQN
ncbi:hypothetical protein FF80_02091 [Devosia sp. LC5]|uniref:tryptophan-rich sensory protein n=1 Tax=Devosia sp. LC5 TaxID=1502724 RepID=UPI0004E3A885|nr:tryptophan-rich sensory protein [Devosia sp. LC5]KFC67695.1 hypothetical protein FF80_02091 [Devosia sp. LC5]